MDTLSYRVILQPEITGGFSVVIPAWPHVHTQGDSIEEALAMARDAIELELELASERDEEIPASDAEHVVIARVTVPPPAA